MLVFGILCRTPMKKKENEMKKLLMIIVAISPIVLAGCGGHCENEPTIEENHKLIVPPNFGARPAK